MSVRDDPLLSKGNCIFRDQYKAIFRICPRDTIPNKKIPLKYVLQVFYDKFSKHFHISILKTLNNSKYIINILKYQCMLEIEMKKSQGLFGSLQFDKSKFNLDCQ